MIAAEFEFHAPKELTEVLRLVERYGEGAKVLAGGMSLVPAMNLGLVEPRAVISLNHISGLDYITEDGGALRVGAMVRHQEIRTDASIRRWWPMLSEAAAAIGDVQVRHRGTIGGSIVHADPAADYLPVLVAAGARFKLQSRRGIRTASSREFFVDIMRTTIEPVELLVEIEIPKPRDGSGSAYLRLARVEGAYAIASAAAIATPVSKDVLVAVGAVCATPVIVEEHLESAEAVSATNLERIGRAAYEACAEAYGDVSGEAEYRRAMAGVLARRVVKEAVTRSHQANTRA